MNDPFKVAIIIISVSVLTVAAIAVVSIHNQSGQSQEPAQPEQQADSSHASQREASAPQEIKPQQEPSAPKDTTLAGFDVSLNLHEFQAKYADKIKSCDQDFYSDNDIAPDQKLPITICSLNSHDGAAMFYDGQLYRFQTNATGENIKIWVAAEELGKKAKRQTAITTFVGFSGYFCAASVAFGDGEASVISDSIIDDFMLQDSQGNHDRVCSESIFLKKNWERLIYDRHDVKEAMKLALAKLRVTADREAAGKVGL